MEAKTIHRLLEVEWGDGERPVFRRDLQNPIDADALIIDELSMIDTVLFANLLEAVPFGCRLILVGDSDQLPPVGAGNVLHDLIDSGLIPVIRLNQVFRQAEQSRIVTNAHRIIRGEMPEIKNDGDFFFLERKNAVFAARTVTELCTTRLPEAYGISPIDDLQVLCPSRNGLCGTENLNKSLQEQLNPADDKRRRLRLRALSSVRATRSCRRRTITTLSGQTASARVWAFLTGTWELLKKYARLRAFWK